MSGIRGWKGRKEGLRVGFFGVAGESGGLRERPAPSLQKSGAATHVASPWTHRSLSDFLIKCHGYPQGSPEVGLGKGYVIHLESWTRQLSTCLKSCRISALSPL